MQDRAAFTRPESSRRHPVCCRLETELGRVDAPACGNRTFIAGQSYPSRFAVQGQDSRLAGDWARQIFVVHGRFHVGLSSRIAGGAFRAYSRGKHRRGRGGSVTTLPGLVPFEW